MSIWSLVADTLTYLRVCISNLNMQIFFWMSGETVKLKKIYKNGLQTSQNLPSSSAWKIAENVCVYWCRSSFSLSHSWQLSVNFGFLFNCKPSRQTWRVYRLLQHNYLARARIMQQYQPTNQPSGGKWDTRGGSRSFSRGRQSCTSSPQEGSLSTIFHQGHIWGEKPT